MLCFKLWHIRLVLSNVSVCVEHESLYHQSGFHFPLVLFPPGSGAGHAEGQRTSQRPGRRDLWRQWLLSPGNKSSVSPSVQNESPFLVCNVTYWDLRTRPLCFSEKRLFFLFSTARDGNYHGNQMTIVMSGSSVVKKNLPICHSNVFVVLNFYIIILVIVNFSLWYTILW